MKLVFIFLLIFVVHPAVINGERISVIGSQFIPSLSNYKVFLLTNKLKEHSSVDFSLLTSDGFVNRTIDINGKDTFDEVEFELPDENSVSLQLNIETKTGNKCNQESIKLFNAFDTPKVFIQFDKPIYKTGDEFIFRIFVMDNKLIPIPGHPNIDISIIDAKGYTVQKFMDIETSEFGVYKNSLKIADAPNLGNWKIQANVMDRNVEKTFGVHQPSVENLEVFIESASSVAFVDRRMAIAIIVKDNTDKLFIGTASIFVKARFINSDKIEIDQHVKDVDIVGVRKGVTIDIQEDMSIRFPTDHMMLTLTVEVTDQATKRVAKVSKDIELKYGIRNTIQVVRKKYFKPGFKFPTKVKVKLLNGQPDSSFNQLTIINEYHKKNSKIDSKLFKVNLKNGEIPNILQTKQETVKIVVKLEFAGAKFEEEILPLPTFGANEYMQIALAKKGTNIGDTIQIQAQTSGELETLHVFVIGQEGIIHTAEYPDAAGLDVYKFSLKLTEKMKPEARVFVFYVHPRDGVIIYDELTLNLGFSIENSLEISATPAAKPSKSMNVQFKTEQGSKVFLSATDFNTAGITRDNEISRTEVYNELVHYLNLKFPNSSYYHFEKLNVFVVNPLQTGESCENGPAKILTYDSEEQPLSDGNDVKYFPDILFDQHYDATTNKEQSITLDVPNSLNTWKYFGVSVHPQKGFTVAKVQPRTAVKSDMSIQLKAPNSAFKDEILWINVGVYNFLSQDLQSNVFVSVENGFFVGQRLRSEYNQQCLDFKSKRNKDENFSLRLSGEKLSETKTFLVQSDGNGDMIIKVTAAAGSNSDEVTKVIKIENKIQKNLIISQLIELNEAKRSEEFDFKDSAGMSMAVYGNLMGPALDGLETMFKHKLTSDEERMLKFAAAVTSYKFLELINQLSDEKVKKLENDITTGYQEALAVLDKILNQNKPNSVWLAAMTVQILHDVPEFIIIHPDLIVNSLEFIVTQQQDGKFKYDGNFDYRKEMASLNRQDIQAAQIIPAFMKDDGMKDLYKDEIAKTMQYLKSKHSSFPNDYVMIIAAYTSALNNDLTDARTLLMNTKNAYKYSSEKPQHNAIFVEIVSYKILTKILLKEDPQEEVKWLLSQRHADGGWNSPYDTVLALQALYEYAKFKNVQSVGLSIDQTRNAIKNPIELQVTKLASDKVKFSGKILGYAAFYDEQQEQPTNTSKYFIIKASRVEEGDGHFKIDISLTANEKAVNNLVVLEVELPRGFRYIQHDQDESVLNVDIRNDHNLVIFYIKKLEINQEVKQTIHAMKVFEFGNHRFSVIKAYDQYRTTVQDTFYYSFDKNEEACERIRVEKEIEKANKSVRTAETAESLTTEARRTIEKAEKDVKDAEARVKIAEDNIKTAYGAVMETQEVLTNTLSTAEDAVKISNKAENIKAPKTAASFVSKQSVPKPFSPSSPRVSNDEEPIITTTRKSYPSNNSRNRVFYTQSTTTQPQTTRTYNFYGYDARSRSPATTYQPHPSYTHTHSNNAPGKTYSSQRTTSPKTSYQTQIKTSNFNPTNQEHYVSKYSQHSMNQFNNNLHVSNQRAQGTNVQNSNAGWNYSTSSTYDRWQHRNKRSVQQEDSEAIRTQNIARDTQQKYIKAQQEARLANQELEAANQKLVKAQQEALTARNEASIALNEVKNAQKTAKQAQSTTLLAQTATKKAEENIKNTENTANAAKSKFDTAQVKVKQTRQIFDQTQDKVTSTLTLARTALQNAIKALKGSDVQAEVDKAIEMANDAKDEATRTLELTKDTQTEAAAALKDSIDAQKASEITKAESESVLNQSRAAQQAAKDALDKSNETKNKLEKAREVEEEKEALASVAQGEFSQAQIKSTSADEESKQAQDEATRTLQEANKAKMEEANRAKLNAQQATREAATIEEMTAFITSEARRIDELRTEAINIRKVADLIRQSLPATQIQFNLIKQDETKKVNNINKLFKDVQKAIKEAESVNNEAKLAAEEATRLAELSQNATDAVDTTNESTKVSKKLNDIKRLSETVNELKSRTEEDRKLVEEAKLSAEATKRAIEDAKLAYDEAILANSNLIEINKAKTLMDNTIQAAKKAVSDAKIQEDLNELINFEYLELDMKNALTKASDALSIAESASKLASQAAEEARGTEASTIAMQKADKAQMERQKVQSEKTKTEEARKDAEELQKIAKQVSNALSHTIQASKHLEETISEATSAEEASRPIEGIYNATVTAMLATNDILKSIMTIQDQSTLNIISDVQNLVLTQPAKTILVDTERAVNMAIQGVYYSRAAFLTAKNTTLESHQASIEQDAINLVKQAQQQEQISKNGRSFAQTAKTNILELQKSVDLTRSIAESLQKTAKAVQKAVQDVIVSTKAASDSLQAQTDTKTKYDEVSILTGDKDKRGAHENRQAGLQEAKAAKQALYARDALQKAVTQLKIAVNAWQAIGDGKDVVKLEEELEKASSAAIEAEKEAINAGKARKLAEDAQNAAIQAQTNIQAIHKDAVKARRATEIRNSQNQMNIITKAVPKITSQAQNIETISEEVKLAYIVIRYTFNEVQKSSFKHLITKEIESIKKTAHQALDELTKAEKATTEAQEAKNATEVTKSRAEEELKIVNESDDIKSVIKAAGDVKIEADNIPIYTEKGEEAKRLVEASKVVVFGLQKEAQEAQQKIRAIEKKAEEAYIKEQLEKIAENVKKAKEAEEKAKLEMIEAQEIDEASKIATYKAENATMDIEEVGNTQELKIAKDAYGNALNEILKSDKEFAKAQNAANSAIVAKAKVDEAYKTAKASTDFNIIKDASTTAENQANEVVKFAQQVESAKQEIEKIKIEAEKYIKIAVDAKERVKTAMAGEIKRKIEKQVKIATDAAQKTSDEAENANNLYKEIEAAYQKVKKIREDIDKMENRQLVDKEFRDVQYAENDAYSAEEEARIENDKAHDAKNKAEMAKELAAGTNSLTKAKEEAEIAQNYSKTTENALRIIKDAKKKVENAKQEADVAWKTASEKEKIYTLLRGS